MKHDIGGVARDSNENPIFDGNYVWYHERVLIVEKTFSTTGGHYADLLTVDKNSVPHVSTRMLERATTLEYIEYCSRDRVGSIPRSCFQNPNTEEPDTHQSETKTSSRGASLQAASMMSQLLSSWRRALTEHKEIYIWIPPAFMIITIVLIAIILMFQ